jgi:hypothetical protein
MRLTITFALALTLAALSGCAVGSSDQTGGTMSAPNAAPQQAAAGGGDVVMKTVSLQETEDAATPQQQQPGQPGAVERKIIRNATLTLEADDPSKVVQRIASVAESRGGFVVTSESRQQGGSRGSKGYEIFTVEMRVPAAQFDAALAEIRSAGGGVSSERITGKDVTEEYIDLEARLRQHRALETQLMEIMKRAEGVQEAIAVQRELTNVRTEIDRLEGRRRFLENQSSLSTISVTIQPTEPLVSTTGFFSSLGRALGQGVDIAATITLFLVSFLLAILPVVVFFGLVYLLLRYVFRRVRRARPAPPPQPPAQEYQQPPPPVA